MKLIVLFGITGDLSRKKLIPALSTLKDVKVIGIGRRNLTKEQILGKNKLNFEYFQADISEKDFYKRLEKKIKKEKYADLIYYLSTLPELYGEIAKNLTIKGKIAFEKPFGFDIDSSKKLDRQVKKLFPEEKIFRIDHYLGKELVKNITSLRFTNVLEGLWNSKFIDSVKIELLENVDVEERINFYDRTGAIKDVVQNHMLQLLSLIAMEPPEKLEPELIRNKKVSSLRKVSVNKVVCGQYSGYGMKSKTETLASIDLRINNKRWKGVPFYLVTGKKLDKKSTTITINFKDQCHAFDKLCPKTNKLIIQVQPDEGIHFLINTSTEKGIEQVDMEFCHHCTFDVKEAYEYIFKGILDDDHSFFVRSDEVLQSWKITEEILKKQSKLVKYASFPSEARLWNEF